MATSPRPEPMERRHPPHLRGCVHYRGSRDTAAPSCYHPADCYRGYDPFKPFLNSSPDSRFQKQSGPRPPVHVCLSVIELI